MIRLKVIGSPQDLALAGVGEPTEGELIVALGEAADAPATLRLLDRAPQRAGKDGERLIAPGGEGLWSCAPWPASDTLFELSNERLGTSTVLAGEDNDLRGALEMGAAARGLELEVVERLGADMLRRAACVILLDAEPDTLPALAPAVLAAGRILIVPQASVTFGFQAPLDHLQFDAPERALNLAQSVLAHPEAFERLRAWGTLAAERHRASRVYERLAQDIAMAETSGSSR